MTTKRIMYKLARGAVYFVLVLIALAMITFSFAYLRQDEIKQGIIDGFNERLNGTFAAEKIDFTVLHHFPDFSISLKNISLHDTIGKVPVIKAEKIYVDIGFYALFRNEIRMHRLSIENGTFFLYRGKNAYSNSSVFKPKTVSQDTTSSGKSFTLNANAIGFKNLAFNYIDSLKEKRIVFLLENSHLTLTKRDGTTEVDMNGGFRCQELTFNENAGSFLKEKNFELFLKLQHSEEQQKLTILPSVLNVGSDKILLDGDFMLNDEALFRLHFETGNILLKDGLSYVTKQIQTTLEKFSVDKPVQLDVEIRGKHNESREPEADVKFSSEEVNFSFGKLNVQNLTCTGEYLHRPDSIKGNNDENSTLKIDPFHATVEHIGFDGNVTFSRLYDPVMDLSVTSKITAAMFNGLVDTAQWVCKSGKFTSSVQYKGRLEEYLDETTSRYYGKLRGNFRARNGKFLYKTQDMILDDVNGTFHFNEKQFNIDTLTLALNGSPVRVNGSMKDYIPFFIQPKNKGFVTLNVFTPSLDLSFIAKEQKEEKKSKWLKNAERKKLTNVLNTLQQKLEFNVDVFADDFIFKKFRAQDIHGHVNLNGDILEASNIQMNVAGGKVEARIFFRQERDERKYLTVNTQITNADIRQFFTLFNNFNQKTILADNLAGSITATANFSSMVFRNYSIDRNSMKGNITCTITDGQLINFEPLENISNFLFKKRDFSDVHFAELESYFDIDGPNIDIERMEVQSNVLSFFLQGRYSFADSTSMSLQLPLSNLKKRDKDFKPENIGTHSKSGPSVYLHIFRDKDINSKINIAYDPFKKWVKE